MTGGGAAGHTTVTADGEHPVDAFVVVDEMRAAFADVPDDEIEREPGRIIAEVREASPERDAAARVDR